MAMYGGLAFLEKSWEIRENQSISWNKKGGNPGVDGWGHEI